MVSICTYQLVTNWTFITVRTWTFMYLQLHDQILRVICQYMWDFVSMWPAPMWLTVCSDRLCVELWLTCDEGGTSPSSAEPAAVRSHLSWLTASHSWWVSSVKYRRGQTQSCNQYKQFGVVVSHLGITVKLPVECNPVIRVALHLHFTVDAVHWWQTYQ